MREKNFRPSLINWFLMIVFVGVFVVPRLANLGTYTTADEPLYLKSSASFYYLLREGRFDETDLIIHPGMVNLWAGAAGYFLIFPEYAQHPDTSFPIGDHPFRVITEQSGHQHTEMLAYGRGITVLIQALLLGIALYFGQRVLGRWPAFIGFLVLSFDPYYFANSRILQPDGILAASLVLSLLAFLDFQKTGKYSSLVISGLGAGLCWLSKLVGIVLGPMVFGMAVFAWVRSPREQRKRAVLVARDLLVWLLVAVVLLIVLWPAMWSSPLDLLGAYFKQSFLMSQDVNSPMFFNGELNPEGEFGLGYWYYYLYILFNLTTPVVLLGLTTGLILYFWKNSKKNFGAGNKSPEFSILIALVIFLVLLTLSSKKADRYAVSAFLMLDLLAGSGIWMLAKQLKIALPKLKIAVSVGLVGVLVGLQVFFVWRIAPYYHAYYNPLWGNAERYADRFQIGWGEGLNRAAIYLNKQKGSSKPVVYTWYGAVFDFYYDDRSHEIFISPELMDSQFEEILLADYAVIYISQWKRQPDTLLIRYLADKQPEHIVEINGFEYVKVYNMRDLQMPENE